MASLLIGAVALKACGSLGHGIGLVCFHEGKIPKILA
jgi:hypothetical protein